MGVADLDSNNWNFYITLIPILLELSTTLAYGGLRRGWDSNFPSFSKMAVFAVKFASFTPFCTSLPSSEFYNEKSSMRI